MSQKLNQILAVEKSVKSRVYGEITDFHKINKKPDLFNGLVKSYRPLDESGEKLPDERKKVQFNTEDVIKKVTSLFVELIDVTLTKDHANKSASASIVVDGKTLVTDVPATTLLFFDKQFIDLRTFIDGLPVLDEAEDWTKDGSAGIFKTESISTHRTKKSQKPIVLYPATAEHPAQTQLITEDILVGHWETVKHSGAISASRKAELLSRVDALIKATKMALKEANDVEAEPKLAGTALFEFVFA